jgi:4-hydroxythreonine-4-phosphate dehydrogenase
MSSVQIAISMGDPAGIGPEVVIRACAALDAEQVAAEPVVFGDPDYLVSMAEELDVPPPAQVVSCGTVEPGLRPGRPRLGDGRVALECIAAAAGATERGDAAALVTAPVSKNVIAAGEPGFKGHTEYLASRLGIAEPLMVFAAIRPAIALLTTHLPLVTAIAAVRKTRIVRAVQRLDEGWSRWFGTTPRIAVAALNPHAGEYGLLGCEDDIEVRPAVAEARRQGADVRGPLPADSVLRAAEIDVVLALYHDQGTIMAKSFPTPSVNTTFGLPYPRTSPDHGVAYDIAARHVADPAATVAAIRLAMRMAQHRER